MTPEPDSIDALTRDPAAAELMRRALRERAQEYAGTPLGEKFADVLAGRLDVRALGDDPAFAELADRTRVAFEDYWAGLPADEREAAVRAGNARLAEVAEELGLLTASTAPTGSGLLALPFWVKALLVGRFVNALGSMAWVFVPLYLVSDRGLDTPEAGSIAAVYGVGIIVGNLVGGSVGDRFGMRSTLAVASLAAAVGCALVPFTQTSALPVVLGLMGALGGIGRPVSFALITGALPTDQRRQASALMRAVNNAGTVLGPPIGGLVAAWDFTWIFVGDAVASLFMLAVVLGVVPRTARVVVPEGVPRRVLGALRRDPRFVLLLVTVAVVDTSYRFAYTAVPWQLDELGAEPWVYGTTISLNCALIVLFEPYLAHRLRHREAWRLIALGFLLVGLGWLVIAPVAGVAVTLVAVAVVTAGEMLYKPTATATAADHAPDGMHGRYQSLYGAASLAGLVIAPPLAGWLLTIGSTALWLGGGALGLAGAALLAVLWPRLPAHDRVRE